jgi:TatD DNase family protein
LKDQPKPGYASLVDTHAHLDFEDFNADLDQVVRRAEEFGVTTIVTIGIEPADWAPTLAIADRYSNVFPAVGIHPNSADQSTDEALASLAAQFRRADGKRPVGIGETGLDFYREHVPHDRQRESFKAHLDIARELDVPVIIHNRDAHADVLDILKRYGKGTRGVMHSFSGDLEFARECIALDYMISLAGPVTFKKAVDKHEVARWVPLDRLLVETDCPFLTPEPYRGRRNEPAYVAYTARAIAELRGTPLDEIARATTKNAYRLFSLPEPAPRARPSEETALFSPGGDL